MRKFSITIPATSANNGPGFDSTGIAVSRYLELHVEPSNQWVFEHRSPYLEPNPQAEKHYIYFIANKIAKQYEKKLPSAKVVVTSDIPLARGLGSSASAVVAGIELANQLCDLGLTDRDKLKLATSFEGHPDNVAPAIFGGFVISAQFSNDDIDYIKLPKLELDTVIYIPNVELKTSESRKVLPDSFSRSDATTASGISNLMLIALMEKNYELAGKMMERDLFHEPYRAKLIPNYDFIKTEAKKLGAYGTVISGAGPTMISFVEKNKGTELAKAMQAKLENYDVSNALLDDTGLYVSFMD